MPFGLGFGEMLLILAVLLLLFGAKRLPEVAQGMGKGIRDFKRALNGLEENAMQPDRQQSYLQSNPAPQPAQPQAAPQPAAAEPAAQPEGEPRRLG